MPLSVRVVPEGSSHGIGTRKQPSMVSSPIGIQASPDTFARDAIQGIV
jgi:hypothetical protein